MKGLHDSFLSFKLASLYSSFHAAFLMGFLFGPSYHSASCVRQTFATDLLFYINLFGALQQFISYGLARWGLFSIDQLY